MAALVHSTIIYFLTFRCWAGSGDSGQKVTFADGQDYGLYTFGLACNAGVVFVVNLKLALETHSFTWPCLVIVLCMLLWFPCERFGAIPMSILIEFHARGAFQAASESQWRAGEGCWPGCRETAAAHSSGVPPSRRR